MTTIETTQQYIDTVHGGTRSDLLVAVRDYMQSGDVSIVEQLPRALDDWRSSTLTEFAVSDLFETDAAKAVFEIAVHRISIHDVAVPDRFTAQLSRHCVAAAAEYQLDTRFIEALREKAVTDYDLARFWITNLSWKDNLFMWATAMPLSDEQIFNPVELFRIPEGLSAQNIFEEIILGLPDDELLQLLRQFTEGDYAVRTERLQAILAGSKPHLIEEYIDQLVSEPDKAKIAVAWPYITANTEQFDERCIEFCRSSMFVYPVIVLDGLRGGIYKDLAIEICQNSRIEEAKSDEFIGHFPARFVLSFLAKHNPQLLFARMERVVGFHSSIAIDNDAWGSCYSLALEQWDDGGKEPCMKMPVSIAYRIFEKMTASRCRTEHLDEWIRVLWEHPGGPGSRESDLRDKIIAYKPQAVEDQLWVSLQSKRKADRSCAVQGLTAINRDDMLARTEELLAGKVDARMGAVELLTAIGSEETAALLKNTLKQKNSAKVTKAAIAGLESLGKGASLDDPDHADSGEDILASIETDKIKPLSKSTKEWINLEGLPPLPAKNGDPLTEKALCYLFQAQSKHKTINPAPDAVPVLQQVDRGKSGEFALALLDQWLASSCNAADKWVLTLSGVLGDRRILSALSGPIAGWAQASRHKLAEYAAQAIALVPADESLMLLDLLANRYRSKFRNIGKACKAALEQAAEAQNISVDELADMIVPTLEFNSEYQRPLPDTEIRLVLQPDFKLTFFNPETDKETKSTPGTLPDTAKAEIKTLRTLIRQTIKGQTARLELDLVRQRSWQTQRWQELFEDNPFLQSYASRLVWATLDEDGKQLKLFRRYPNGLLADASGDLIELEQSDAVIVMVHPLNLGEESLTDWQAHLTRMKVTPPFSQLERPVEKLDAKHANRKQIAFTEGHRMASGTFRSRAERLGWIKGSIVDGGGISSYYKPFPGAQVSIILMVEETYIGQDPADPLQLGHGLFVKADSVQLGSYVYDEPKNTDDERVIAFGDVPAVVYSESVSDLKAIMVSK